MSVKRLYAIWDCKSKLYSGIVLFNTDAEAQRFYLVQLRDAKHIHPAHRTDYTIHFLGTFHLDTGDLEPVRPNDVTPYELREALEAQEAAARKEATRGTPA